MVSKVFVPCTLRTTGSLNRSDSRWSRVRTAHITFVLLSSFLARTCNILPLLLVLIADEFSRVNGVALTIQTIMPEVALQLKVAVDPSVALTDVGVVTKAGIHKEHSKLVQGYNYIYSYNILSVHLLESSWIGVQQREKKKNNARDHMDKHRQCTLYLSITIHIRGSSITEEL